MVFKRRSAILVLASAALLIFPAGGEVEGEPAPGLIGAWAVGEDTEVVYSFCQDGTFTQWIVTYWGKCQPPEICKQKVGCGTYITGEDGISNTLDLQFLKEDACIALGRYTWDIAAGGQLYLNIGQCGESRPDSPYYYAMRPSALIDCTCPDEPAEGETEGEPPLEGEGEPIIEGETAEGETPEEGEGESEGEPGDDHACGCCCNQKAVPLREMLDRALSDWLLVGLGLLSLKLFSVNRTM